MQFCRRILQVSNFCKQSSILMELGRLPLALNQIQRTIKFQFRCKYIIQDKLLKSAIHVQEDMQNISYLALQKILDFSNVQSNSILDAKSLNRLMSNIKQFLSKSYKDVSLKYLSHEDGKLTLYKDIKRAYCKEKYLAINNYQYRRAVTKIRLSDHNLPIEKGRRNNIECNKRFCTKCKSNRIGNEEHVLFECHNEELTKLRFKFLAQLLLISPQLKYFPIN